MRQLATAASLCRRGRQRGASLFELAVAAIIVAILTALLLQRLAAYRAQAELVAVQRVAAVLRTALTMKSGDLRGSGRGADIVRLAGSNPFDLLLERPANYLGEYFAPDSRTLEKGNWYFDRKAKSLVYLLNTEKRFPSGTASRLIFTVELICLPSIPAKPDATPPSRSVALIQTNS